MSLNPILSSLKNYTAFRFVTLQFTRVAKCFYLWFLLQKFLLVSYGSLTGQPFIFQEPPLKHNWQPFPKQACLNILLYTSSYEYLGM